MNIGRRFLVSVALLMPVFPAFGHHSAAQFDFSQNVEVEGVVREIQVRNPHIMLILTVTGEDGTVKEIEYEGHSRNNVFRRGWRQDDIHDGDRLTIRIAPLRSGSDEGGYITGFMLENGKEF